MLSISHLRTEYLVNPLGIDERVPRFSWEVEAGGRGRRGAQQVAYRVKVGAKAGGGEMWDSGWVRSGETTQVEYAGRALKSREVCYWGVEVEDEMGEVSKSEEALFSMGLLEEGDWKARWIAADPEVVRRDKEAVAPTLTEPGTPGLFRREFEIGGAVKRATLYCTARGVMEWQANGERVGADLLAPEWTDYDKRIQYRTYDVTGLVKAGRNAIGVTLGDGWWSGYVGWQETRGRYGSLENSVMGQVEVELESGERVVVGTDGSWGCNTGAIVQSDFMMGEIYDARRERAGWDRAEYSGEGWLAAREVAGPKARLVAQRSEPVRITEELTPVSAREVGPGVFIFDLGQNIAGWVRLRVNAKAGTTVTVRHGERLTPEGALYTENLRRAKATDVYVCTGGEEVLEPHFTFHGFQYVEVRGLKALGKDAVRGCMIRSATPEAGHFECSNDDVNRLWLNGVWSQKDNFLSVPTDCPQRDERLGWTGDAQVFLRTASYNMDVAAFFSKWMIDVEDAQTAEGIFPDTAPRLREGENFIGLGNLGGAAGWADAGVIVPFTMWQVYGDRRILERHYEAMVKWVEWIASQNSSGLRVNALGNNYGDWLCIPSDTSFGTHSPMKNLLATAYWADDCAKLARIARELGKEGDAKRFAGMFERVRAAFCKEWVTGEGRVTTETQTGYLLALAFDLLPRELRGAAAEHLVENIRNLDWHLSTGFIGIGHLNPQLTLAGRADVAYRLLLREDYPSWLYPVKHGATTIWERWNGWTEAEGFFNPHMNSFNHYSLGSVGEWLYRHVAGIEVDPEVAGFGRFVLRPFVEEGLTWARGAYRTMHGEIESAWERRGEEVTWRVRIPANTAARVYVPSDGGTAVTEGEVALEKAAGLQVLGQEGKWMVCEAVAGVYTFVSRLGKHDA